MSLVVVTSINVWSNLSWQKERIQYICDKIISNATDLYLIRGITHDNILCIVRKIANLNLYFKVSNVRKQEYELIASKWPIKSWKSSYFLGKSKSKTREVFPEENRQAQEDPHQGSLFWAEIESENGSFMAASCISRSKEQLDCCFSFFQDKKLPVIMGCEHNDLFQTCSKNTMNWQDAWTSVGSSVENKWTFDPERNANIYNEKEKARNHYLFVSGYKCMKMELVGTENACGVKQVPCVLDYGIRCKISTSQL